MPKKQKESKFKNLTSRIKESLRQKRTRRIVISVIIVIILAALGVSGWSIYNFQFKPYQQPAIIVNDVTLDMRYYINMQKLHYGNAPTDVSIPQFPDFVEEQIIQNEVFKQGATDLGFQIDRKDVEADLKKAGLPVTRESVDLLMVEQLIQQQVPKNQPQVYVQAMLLESESAAQEAKARVQEGELFVNVANEVSKIPATKINQGETGWITARGADLAVDSTNFGDMVFGVEPNVLSGPVYDETVTKQYGYWLLRAVEIEEPSDNTTSTRARIEVILVGSEQEANELRDRINTGEDMHELAKEYSQLTGAEDNGAELGWVTKSQDNTSIFDVVFDLPLYTVSDPIGDNQMETKGGYWVFNVLEKDDNRELTSSQQNTLYNDFLNRCTAALIEDPNYRIESLLTQEMKDFAFDEVVLSQGKGSVLIKTTSLPAAEAGVSYSHQIEVYGTKKGNTWSLTEGRMPEGLSLDESTGLISGVPRFGGGAGLTIRVSNEYHYWEQEFTIQIHLPVSVSTESLPNGQVGVEYSFILEVFADTYKYTWTIIDGGLPDGLELRETTGRILGMPTTAGTYNFTVQVDDSFNTATKDLSITIE
jgi:parvulin-like peptidyl-prolyl isomerase